MLENWSRSDIISAIAVVFSAMAVVISLAAATFTFLQYRINRRKEKAEIEAEKPIVEPEVFAGPWPGWYKLVLTVRNVEKNSIRCVSLTVKKPKDARIAALDDVGRFEDYGSLVPPDRPPTDKVAKTASLDVIVPEAGSKRGLIANDLRQIKFLLSRSSTRSAKVRDVLQMSLRTERINESIPYRDVMVVTRMPAISTKTEI